MRRALTLAIAGLFVLLVSAAQAQAQVITFTAQLHGGNEVPVVVTGSAGTATVTWNTVTKTGTYRVDVYNMPVATTAGAYPCRRRGRRRTSHGQLHRPGVGAISNDFGFSGTFACSDVVNAPGAGYQLVRGLRADLAAQQHLRERALDRKSGRRDSGTAHSRRDVLTSVSTGRNRSFYDRSTGALYVRSSYGERPFFSYVART